MQGFLDARYGGSDGKGFDYRVYIKGNTDAPESHPNGQEFDDWRRTQAGFRTDWQINDRDSLTVQGDLYDGLAGESTRIATYAAPYSEIVNKNSELSGANVVGRWVRKFSGGSDLQLQIYYDRVSRVQANQAEYRNTFDFDLVNHLNARKGQQVTWGLSTRISLANLPEVVPTYVFSPPQRTDQVYTAFAQDEIPILKDVSLTIGSKLLHSSFSGFNLEPSARAAMGGFLQAKCLGIRYARSANALRYRGHPDQHGSVIRCSFDLRRYKWRREVHRRNHDRLRSWIQESDHTQGIAGCGHFL